MGLPWVKHWVSKLADPDIACLPDWQWRKLAEFELMAGFEDADGKLPPVDKMGWMLHLAPAKVEEALHQLSEGVGAVHQETDGSWYLTDWRKSQDSPSKERTRRWREKKRHGDGHGDGVTSSSSSSSDSLSLIIKVYESEIGPLTSMISDTLAVSLEDYPQEWIVKAIEQAARNNKRSWSYAEAILKRWKAEGFQSKNKPAGPNGNGKALVKNEDGSYYG